MAQLESGVSGAIVISAINQLLGSHQTITDAMLEVNGWKGGIYNFDDTYSSNIYDLEIAFRCTGSANEADQKTAYDMAEIAGYGTTNQIKAFGTVPTIDIPIILKVVRKSWQLS